MTASNHLFDAIFASGFDRGRVFLYLPSGETLTYGALYDASGQMANALRAAGVTAGDRVAVQVEKTPQKLMLYLACLRTGAIFLPLNTAYTAAEVSYFLGDAEPRIFVCDGAKHDALQNVAQEAKVSHVATLNRDGTGTLVDAMQKQPAAFENALRGPDDLAAILYTSGTTGRSKGAMLSHENLRSNSATLAKLWQFTGKDVLLHALPIYHTHGLFVATNISLLMGGAMVFLQKFDPDEIFKFMPVATAMMGVPTFYVRLLADPRLTHDATKNMRLFVSGSAPLLAETHREWKARTGHAILERYGMTETNMNTSNPYDGDRVAGTVGFPLPDVALRVADPETGAILAQGDIGVIEVKGPNVFKGYWRMPEKTASEFRADGFFITGDLGLIDARGYVQIVGRGKDLIITGGFNVYPKEVETEIDAIAGVVESAVIGIAHKDFGEGVTAVVVRQKGASLTEKQIMSQLEQRLAKFKLPKRIIFVDDLPRNTMGKVQKNVLRDNYAAIFAA
ncbi:MAG: malonate--CoA ligase [Beijerinckiaceae bacterium]